MTARPLTDYDIIGAAGTGSGLFALDGATALQPAVHSAAGARARRRPVDAAGGRALLPRAARAADRRSARQPGPRRAPRSRRCAAGRSAARARSCTTRACRPSTGCAGASRPSRSCGAAAGMIARCGRDLAGVERGGERGGDAASGAAPGGAGVRGRTASRLSQAGINTLLVGARRRDAPAEPAHAGRRRRRLRDWKYLSARRLALFVARQHRAGHALGAARAQWAGRPGSARRRRSRPSSTALARAGRVRRRRGRREPFRHRRRARQPAPAPSPRASSTCCSASPPASPGEFDTWLVTHRAGRQPRAPGVGQPLGDLQAARRVGDRDLDPARLRSVGAPKPPPPGVRMLSSRRRPLGRRRSGQRSEPAGRGRGAGRRRAGSQPPRSCRGARCRRSGTAPSCWSWTTSSRSSTPPPSSSSGSLPRARGCECS